jgi:hypothetical protein
LFFKGHESVGSLEFDSLESGVQFEVNVALVCSNGSLRVNIAERESITKALKLFFSS